MATSRRRQVLEAVALLVAAIAIAVVLRATIAQAFRIPSESMEPQLRHGDRVLVSRTAYDLHHPRRGDVVVFDCPPAAGCERRGSRSFPAKVVDAVLEATLIRQPGLQEFIKRVVALPGETVEGHDGAVWVDGRRLVEPYLRDGTVTDDFPATTVPDGHVWVMGDNRRNSSDSRTFGPVRESTIVGRAVLRVWPPWRAAFM